MYLARVDQKSLPEIGLSCLVGATTPRCCRAQNGSGRQQMTELNQQLHVLEQTLKD
jgi:hypothetical protein